VGGARLVFSGEDRYLEVGAGIASAQVWAASGEVQQSNNGGPGVEASRHQDVGVQDIRKEALSPLTPRQAYF